MKRFYISGDNDEIDREKHVCSTQVEFLIGLKMSLLIINKNCHKFEL